MDCIAEFNSWLSSPESEVEEWIERNCLKTTMYLTLPSNTNDFSTNSTNHFRVLLPKPLSFTGDWQVALIEIQYPVSWSTEKGFEGKLVLTLNCYFNNNIQIPVIIRIPNGYYRNVNELIKALQQVIEKKGKHLPRVFHKMNLAMYKLQMLKVYDPELAKTFPKFTKEQNWGVLRHPSRIPAPRELPKKKKKVSLSESSGVEKRQRRSGNTKEGSVKTELPTEENTKIPSQSQTPEPSPSKPPTPSPVTPPSPPPTEIQIENKRILREIREELRQSRKIMKSSVNLLSEVLKVYYSEEKQRVVIEWHPTMSIKTINFDRSFQFLFGFDSKRKIEQGINVGDFNVSDFNNSTSSFSVYCDLLQLQTVGNSLQQLLRTVAVNNSALGNTVYKEFSSPHYVDILTKKQFDTIGIWIEDETGELLDFQFGKVVLKLHFRRKTLLTL